MTVRFLNIQPRSTGHRQCQVGPVSWWNHTHRIAVPWRPLKAMAVPCGLAALKHQCSLYRPSQGFKLQPLLPFQPSSPHLTRLFHRRQASSFLVLYSLLVLMEEFHVEMGAPGCTSLWPTVVSPGSGNMGSVGCPSDA